MVSDTSMPAATSDPVPNEPISQSTCESLSTLSVKENDSPSQQNNSALDGKLATNGKYTDVDVDLVVRLVNKLHVDSDSVQNDSSTKDSVDTSQQNGKEEKNGESSSADSDDRKAKTTRELVLEDETKSDQEYYFIQDTGFSVKISAPGLETFDIQVSAMELVQEIHQLLMDREDTCHRTCFSLQLDGTTLDNFAELKNVEGLKEGSVIKVVEEPYTIREARIHVRHVRDLLKSIDPADSYNGAECNSLTFLNVITQGDISEKKKGRPDSVDCTPPDFILPNCKERSLLPLQPLGKDQKPLQALKVLTSSGWNPPPGTRKLHGDLMYLYIVTLEDKHFHVTSSTRGFYLNQCTDDIFNPKPANPKVVYHSLVELLSQVSPIFKRNFAIIQKKRTHKHPFERVATPYQIYSWTAPNFCHTIDSIRAEDAFSSKLGYEEHIPGQIRDWNEELQTTRELPRKTLPERLVRERSIFKVHSDFVSAATRGAMAVIDGSVMAINPGEGTKMQMFIWNNIFFSLGFDVRDHYKEFGGDAAAYAAPSNDLQGVKAYTHVDVEGIYTLGTVVVDYRGYRVTAQSIIPGILEKEQEQTVVYGSVDFGKTVVSNPKYLELLGKAGQHLKILPHYVLNEKNEEVKLCSSVECKGIIGNDSRHYILDLLRTFPPDVNYLPIEGEEYSKEAKALGYPCQHKHKLCCLRQELVDAFVEAKYLLFIKITAYNLQQLGLKSFARNGEKLQKSREGSLDADNNKKQEEGEGDEEKDKEHSANNNNCHNADDKAVNDSVENTKCHIKSSDAGHADPQAQCSNIANNSDSADSKLIIPKSDEVTSKDVKVENNPEIKSEDSPSDSVDTQAGKGQVREVRTDSPTVQLCDNDSGTSEQSQDSESLKSKDAINDILNKVPIDSSVDLSFVVEDGSKSLAHEEKSSEKDFCFSSPSSGGDIETDQFKKIVQSYANGDKVEGDMTRDVIRKAARAVGSLKDTEFEIRFNPDVFSPGVRHQNPDGEDLKKQRHLVKDAAHFLLSVQIPALIRDCLEHTASPIDGFTLTEALHSRGINIRYLGRITDMLSKIPQLQYVYSLCVHELICRAAKHVFAVYLQGVDTVCQAAAIAHFLNCFLSSSSDLSLVAGNEEMQIKSTKKKGKKKGKHSPFSASDNEWASLTQQSLWKELKSELDSHYAWNLTPDSMDAAIEHYAIQKVSIMRSFCLKMGVQILLRDYNFDSRTRATFTEDDIINMFPVVKHINPRATDAYNFYTTGQMKIQQGSLKEGYELISEAFNLLNNVYGAMHPEIAQCLRMLARLNYLMGEHGEALSFQQKAVLMSERVNGIDHPYTITEYTHLALYCFANSEISISLKLLYRARYLALLVCGENHPEIAVLDSNIGLILHAVGEYDLSLRFLQNALKLNIKYFGVRSLKVAVNYHLVARTQSCMGDFRGALQNEKETYAIYKFQLGEEHEKTKESSDCLRHLTQQAVVLQKTMNEIYKGTAGAILPPIQIQAPSMSSVLDMLNIINGILFVHISQQDIDNIRSEMERRQKRDSSEKTESKTTQEAKEKVNVTNGR